MYFKNRFSGTGGRHNLSMVGGRNKFYSIAGISYLHYTRQGISGILNPYPGGTGLGYPGAYYLTRIRLYIAAGNFRSIIIGIRLTGRTFFFLSFIINGRLGIFLLLGNMDGIINLMVDLWVLPDRPRFFNGH
jgi:hypothetical protein